MNRREILKLGLLSGGAMLLSGHSNRAMAAPVEHPTGGIFEFPSPEIKNPFKVELRRMPRKTGVADLSLPENHGVAPNGTVYPQVTGKDSLTTYVNSVPGEKIVATQQLIMQFSPKLFYVLNVRQAFHDFHPEMTALTDKNLGSVIWGYDGIYPGPTFMSKYGEPILVRIHNGLYDDPDANPDPETIKPADPGTRFGNAQITTHLHNGHSASESDGNPSDFYPPVNVSYPDSINEIRFRDHHYTMFRAGLDPKETVSTLWYHDHSDGFTAANVYRGLVGFHLFFDDIDSNNENDPDHRALRLPSGEFDIPLLFQDKVFNHKGQLILDALGDNNKGFLGDRFTVNGQIQPELTVERRKYRFRLLNAGPSRFYQFSLTKKDPHTQKDVDQEFTYIGNDESLLEKPLCKEKSVLLSVAERADVVIDFSQYEKGEELYLVNRLVMKHSGIGPEFVDEPTFEQLKILPVGEGDQILRFAVRGDVVADPSRVPAKLRSSPDLPSYLFDPATKNLLTVEKLINLPNHTKFEFQLKSGVWLINNTPFDPHTPGATMRPVPVDPAIPEGETFDGYVWTIKNEPNEDWSHPIHIHLEEFRILWRKGKEPPVTERCSKDVLLLRPREEVQIFLRFREFIGKYPIHCHNVLHEDNHMMMRYDVKD